MICNRNGVECPYRGIVEVGNEEMRRFLQIIDLTLCFRTIPFLCSFPPIILSDPSLPCYFTMLT